MSIIAVIPPTSIVDVILIKLGTISDVVGVSRGRSVVGAAPMGRQTMMITRVRELLHFHESAAQYNKLSVSVIFAIFRFL